MWDACINDRGIATLRCIPVAISALISYAFVLSGVTAVIFIVLSGIKFMLSGGDPLKVAGARKTITFAIIGLALVLLSFFALKVISTLTGVECEILGIKC